MSDDPQEILDTPIEESSGADAYIQEVQKQRAQKIKRVFFALGALVTIAVLISAVVAWQSRDVNQTADFDELKAELDTNFSTQEQEAAREAFKQALLVFEDDILPTLTQTNIAKWRPKEVEAIRAAQERAVALFARSGFMQALGALNQASEDAKTLTATWHQSFDDKLSEAEDLYAQGQIQKARLALAQANKIKPSHPDSRTVSEQLGAYEQVMDYLAQLKVAEVENNIENQVSLLQQILKADPTRVSLKASLERATKTLNDQRLSFALNEARQALAQDDINRAVTYVQNAQEIRPGAMGIKALSEELAKRTASQSLASLRAQIQAYSQQDAWDQALQTTKRALNTFSQDAQLKQSQAQATQVLNAQQSLQRFLVRPERLADKSIREAAKSSLQGALLLLPKSNKLAEQAQALASLLDTYSSRVALTINSDEQTHISVIGVGIVGEVNSKVIELSPGKYTLEGRREGYRSKRVDIEIEADTPQSLTLVCDEKIS